MASLQPVLIASDSTSYPGASSAPLLAQLDDEAEVVIVPRAGAAAVPASAPRRSAHAGIDRDEPILPVDLEAQGGEGYDSRSLAAYRGIIEEASVEIVVRKPAQPRQPGAHAARAGTVSGQQK